MCVSSQRHLVVAAVTWTLISGESRTPAALSELISSIPDPVDHLRSLFPVDYKPAPSERVSCCVLQRLRSSKVSSRFDRVQSESGPAHQKGQTLGLLLSRRCCECGMESLNQLCSWGSFSTFIHSFYSESSVPQNESTNSALNVE